jgi:diguanylate cyclase (GGDEF)-like protein
VTLSAGVAGYPDNARDAEELIHAADKALYAAKASGRNRTMSCQHGR